MVAPAVMSRLLMNLEHGADEAEAYRLLADLPAGLIVPVAQQTLGRPPSCAFIIHVASGAALKVCDERRMVGRGRAGGISPQKLR